MIPEDRLEQIKQRFEYVEARMAQASGGDDIAALGREYAELKPVVDQIAAYRQLRADLADAEAMLDDPDMRELAEEELPVLKARVPEAEAALQLALLPKDAADARPAMIEIRPGTGGEEAALFAGDCCACTSAMPRRGAGALTSSRNSRPSWAASRRSWPM